MPSGLSAAAMAARCLATCGARTGEPFPQRHERSQFGARIISLPQSWPHRIEESLRERESSRGSMGPNEITDGRSFVARERGPGHDP